MMLRFEAVIPGNVRLLLLYTASFPIHPIHRASCSQSHINKVSHIM